jgi:hypothetical protein
MISIQNLRHYDKTSRASTQNQEIWMTFGTDISCSPTLLEQMAGMNAMN